MRALAAMAGEGNVAAGDALNLENAAHALTHKAPKRKAGIRVKVGRKFGYKLMAGHATATTSKSAPKHEYRLTIS